MVIISLAIVLGVLTSLVHPGAVQTENKCPGTFFEIFVTDCTGFPCNMYRGKEYTVEIDFSPFSMVNSSSVKCNTVYLGRPYEMPEEPACKDMTPTCPLNPETKHRYTYKFTIAQIVPNGHYPIRCALVDESKTEHICLNGAGKVIG